MHNVFTRCLPTICNQHGKYLTKDFLCVDFFMIFFFFFLNLLFVSNLGPVSYIKSACKRLVVAQKLAGGDLFYRHTIMHEFCSKEIR